MVEVYYDAQNKIKIKKVIDNMPLQHTQEFEAAFIRFLGLKYNKVLCSVLDDYVKSFFTSYKWVNEEDIMPETDENEGVHKISGINCDLKIIFEVHYNSERISFLKIFIEQKK